MKASSSAHMAPMTNAIAASPNQACFRKFRRAPASILGVPCVGDSLRDLQAGASMGCSTFLVKTGKGKKTLEKSKDELPKGTLVFDNLTAVAEHLVPDDPFANNR